jgi:PAS domain S-box-containing protein
MRKRSNDDLAAVGRLELAEAAAERFRDLVDGLDAIVWEADAASLTFSFVSRRAEEILGYPVARWLAEPDFWTTLAHPEERDRVLALCRHDRDHTFEFRAVAADGRVVWLRNCVRVGGTSARGTPQLRGLMLDISPLKLAEESRKRLIALIEAAPFFIGISDARGREQYINRAGRNMLGLGEQEDISAMRVADHQPQWATALLQSTGIPTAIRTGVWSGETALLHRDGHELPIAQVILAHQAPGGRVEFFATIARDITEQKRAMTHVAALLEIAKDITGTLELGDILGLVQQRTANLLPCERVFTYYWDPARNIFRAIGHYGLPAELAGEATAVEFRLGQPIVDRVIGGQTVVINDVAQQNLVAPELLAHFGICALVAVPLAVRGRILGAFIAVRTQRDGSFETSQVELLESIARHVAVAIETTELYRTQQSEAQIAAALARVGREMISSLDTPIILDRLCQATTAVLECDCSHTLLWRPEDDEFVPVSGYGYSPEQWESIRAMKLPRRLLAPGLAGLEREEVINLDLALFPHVPATLALQYGVTHALCVGLRRRGEIIGMHVACYRHRHEAFTAEQERIASGIAQLASLALENARLVEELERASRLKSDFVATMSHELRTPLNVIVGYNDLLLDGAFGALSAEQSNILRRIESSAQALLELITATLDVSRLEAGRVPVDVHEVRVADLLGEIAAATRELEKPGLHVRWNVPPELPVLRTDPVKLKVVLKNLIGNAVKFTDKGSVTVGVHAHDEQIEFYVADTGIGIAPDERLLIFEPFRQADSSMTRRHGGAGLGLYIARRLVEMLGGAITVDSEVGRGSTFRVAVPTGKHAIGAAPSPTR